MIMFLAALHYWWPKITGRCITKPWPAFRASWSSWLQCHVFPAVRDGHARMPRRYATYKPEFTSYHILSSIGAFLQFAAFALIAGYLILLAAAAAGARPPTRGVAPHWSGCAVRRLRTTISPRRQRWGVPMTTPTWC